MQERFYDYFYISFSIMVDFGKKIELVNVRGAKSIMFLKADQKNEKKNRMCLNAFQAILSHLRPPRKKILTTFHTFCRRGDWGLSG